MSSRASKRQSTVDTEATASSPRRRSRSPTKTRSQSPRKRSTAKRRISTSPTKTSSPRKGSSPRKRRTSPKMKETVVKGKEGSIWRKMPILGSQLVLYDKYNAEFLNMTAVQYFNQGTKVLTYLATQDMLKNHYKLEPGEVQTLNAFMMIPWSIKLLYGLISDNISIFGSKRKSYLLIMGLAQSATMSIMAYQIDHMTLSVNAVSYLFFLSSLSVAFSDVIVDSLMVVHARKDPDLGSEELSAFQWICMAAGGLLGSVIAAFLTENNQSSACFAFSAMMGFFIVLLALRLDAKCEQEGLTAEEIEQAKNSNLVADLKRYFREIVEAFKEPAFRNVIIYLLLSGLLVPQFSSFSYFFMMDVIKLSKFTYSMLTVLGYTCLMIGTSLYNSYLKEKEYKHLILASSVIFLLVEPLHLLVVTRKNLEYGLPDLGLIIFDETVTDIVSHCLIFLPMTVIFAKITPKHIEATSFALLAGVSNFRGTLRGYIGAAINDRFVGVTQDDLSNYYILDCIHMACAILPMFFIFLIPSRGQVQTAATVTDDSTTTTTSSAPKEATKDLESPTKTKTKKRN